MKTFFKITASFISMLLLGAGIFGGLIYWSKDKIINRFLHEANKSLKTPVKVEGIKLVAWQDFPLLSLVISKAYVEDSFPEQSPLFEAEKVSFSLNAYDVWQGRYNVRQLRIKNAEIHVKINARGEGNYEIVNAQPTPSNEKPAMTFNLSDIKLSNVSADISHESSQTFVALFSEKLTLDIARQSDRLDMRLRGSVRSDKIAVGDRALLIDKLIAVNTGLHYATDANKLTIDESDLTIDGSTFRLAGDILFAERPNLDLRLSNNATTWASLLSLLPKQTAALLLPYEGEGNMYFDARLKGVGSAASAFAKFGFENAAFKHPESGVKITKANLVGALEMASVANPVAAKLSLKNITGVFDRRPFAASLTLNNFQRPTVDFFFTGGLNLAQSVAFLNQQKNLQQASGDLQAEVRLQGDIEKLKNKATAQQVKVAGTIELQRINFIYGPNGVAVKNLDGALHFNNNDLALTDLRASVDKSDFQLNGFFRNIVTYLLFENQPLAIDAALQSQHLDLDNLFSALFKHKSDNKFEFRIPKNLRLNFKTDVSLLKYGRFKGRQIKGILAVKDQLAVTQKLSFQSLGGAVHLNGFIDAKNDDKVEIDIGLNTTDISVDSVFYLFDNFGQSFIQQKHLKGKGTATAGVALAADKQLNVDPASITAGISIVIKDGELNDFEPMQRLSRFIDDKELSRLRFGHLKNEIFIEKKTVYIPQMEIASNLNTLLLSGTHAFDQRIDYRVVTPLQFKKKIDPDEAFGAIEEDKTGKTKLYLKITGTTDNYVVAMDKNAVKKKISESIKKESQELKDALKNKPQKKKEIQLQQDDYFDWDSNDVNKKEDSK